MKLGHPWSLLRLFLLLAIHLSLKLLLQVHFQILWKVLELLLGLPQAQRQKKILVQTLQMVTLSLLYQFRLRLLDWCQMFLFSVRKQVQFLPLGLQMTLFRTVKPSLRLQNPSKFLSLLNIGRLLNYFHAKATSTMVLFFANALNQVHTLRPFPSSFPLQIPDYRLNGNPQTDLVRRVNSYLHSLIFQLNYYNLKLTILITIKYQTHGVLGFWGFH